MDFIKGNEQVKIDPSGIEISGTNNILLKSDGKVGIGTNNPQYPLQVNGSHAIFSNTPELLLFKEYGPGRLGPTLDWGNTTYTDWKIKAEESGLKITSGSSGVTTESITINNTGNVGIGTTAPTDKLDLHGNLHIEGDYICIRSDANNDGNTGKPAIYFSEDNYDAGEGTTHNDNGNMRIIYNGDGMGGDDNFIAIQSRTAANEFNDTLLHCKRNGYTGIGTSAPTEKLEVNGNIKANGFKIPVILFGNVKSDGGIEDAGSGGWSSTRTSNGKYTVTFTTSFSAKPTVVITQVHGGYSTTNGHNYIDIETHKHAVCMIILL